MLDFSATNVMRLLLLLVVSVGLVSAGIERCPTDLPSTTAVRVFGDICYQFVSEERYWTNARDYCIQYGGRLVKIDDAETNNFIVTTLNGLWWRNRGVWIGLHDRHAELRWQWIGNTRYTNDPATWFNWAHGHPKAFLHSLRDCVRMGRNDGRWLWHETPCSSLRWKYRFICQYEMAAPSSSTTSMPPTTSTPALGVVPGSSRDWQPDTFDRHGHWTLSVPSTSPSTSHTSPALTTTTENDAAYEYVVANSVEEHKGKLQEPANSSWVIVLACSIALCIVLIILVLLWRRRADRRLRMVAVAADDGSEEEPEKDSKIVSMSLLSTAPQHAKSNLYNPEPRAPATVKVVSEGDVKKSDVSAGVYCPMNGMETSEYLEPRPSSGYLAMCPPPDYDACISQQPEVPYANTENEDRAADTTYETEDCSMMGYDVPPPLHVYSEIPADSADIDEEGNHIYESLDQAQ